MKRTLHLVLPGLLCIATYSVSAQRPAQAALPDAPVPQLLAADLPIPLFSDQEEGISSSTTQNAVPAAPATHADAPQATQNSADQVRAAEKQRMLGIIPEFNTVEAANAVPLTKGEKFHLWYKSSFDPFTFATAALDAGVEQAENSYPGYNQGAAGYGRRFGASYGDTVDGNFWGNAVLPVLLKQDPRYFRLGQGSFKRRLGWAALSTVRTKGDNGKWEPGYSNISGNLIAGAISNLYYPDSDRGVGLIFERGLTVTAEGVLGALAYEFYPDAIAYLKRRHQRNHPDTATPAPETASPGR